MPSVKDLEQRWEERPLRTIILGILYVVLITLIIGFIVWIVQIITLPARTATDIAEKTMDADNVIFNYEWFKETKEKVDAYDLQLIQAQTALESLEESLKENSRKDWGFEDKQEWNRLNSVVLGLKNQRASVVADYNAKSKMENRALFKDHDLPDTLK